MKPYETLFLSKAVSASKKDREAVQPGKYEVDLTVNIRGTMTVGEDFEKTESVPYATILAALIQEAGPRKLKRAMEKLQELTEGQKGDLLQEVKDLYPAGTITSKGQVKVTAFYEEVEEDNGIDDDVEALIFD